MLIINIIIIFKQWQNQKIFENLHCRGTCKIEYQNNLKCWRGYKYGNLSEISKNKIIFKIFNFDVYFFLLKSTYFFLFLDWKKKFILSFKNKKSHLIKNTFNKNNIKFLIFLKYNINFIKECWKINSWTIWTI